MTLPAKLARTVLPSLVVALALGACEVADPTEPIGTAESIIATKAVPVAPAFVSAFRGGIPFGVFHLPKEEYGATFNGSLGNISPNLLIGYLETARRSGTKVILTFAGSEANFKNADHTFSLTKWKERVNRYRGLNLTSFINDGTIAGHYLVDEPHDPENWGGKPMPLSAIDAMGEYSKELWPNLPTIARAWPSYLKGYKYKYLDAAWAQYSLRKGPIGKFIQDNVRDAKAGGLALVVGLNQMAGGSSSNGLTGYYADKYAMGASELESWGKALLDEPYACAFISWQFDAKYLARSDIQSAMAALSAKARNRSSRSCSASGEAVGQPEPTPPVVTEPVPPVTTDSVVVAPDPVLTPDSTATDSVATPGPVVTPDPVVTEPPPPVTPPAPPVTPSAPPVTPPAPVVTNPAPPAPAAIKLSVTGSSKGGMQYMRLTWSGAAGSMVDVYRDGVLRKRTENDKYYTNSRSFRGAASYVYKVCERGKTRCSASVRVNVK